MNEVGQSRDGGPCRLPAWCPVTPAAAPRVVPPHRHHPLLLPPWLLLLSPPPRCHGYWATTAASPDAPGAGTTAIQLLLVLLELLPPVPPGLLSVHGARLVPAAPAPLLPAPAPPPHACWAQGDGCHLLPHLVAHFTFSYM